MRAAYLLTKGTDYNIIKHLVGVGDPGKQSLSTKCQQFALVVRNHVSLKFNVIGCEKLEETITSKTPVVSQIPLDEIGWYGWILRRNK